MPYDKCRDCGKKSFLIVGRCRECNKRIFEEIKNHEAEKKKESKNCKNCGKFSYHLIHGLCKECHNLKNPKKDYKAYRKPKYFPRGYIGQCKLCKKEIYGKEGTYAIGKGLAHKKCYKAYKKLKAIK